MGACGPGSALTVRLVEVLPPVANTSVAYSSRQASMCSGLSVSDVGTNMRARVLRTLLLGKVSAEVCELMTCLFHSPSVRSFFLEAL